METKNKKFFFAVGESLIKSNMYGKLPTREMEEDDEAESLSIRTPIDEVIDFFINAKKEGATHVNFDSTVDEYDGDVTNFIQPFACREETDFEKSKRISNDVEALKLEADRLRRRLASIDRSLNTNP